MFITKSLQAAFPAYLIFVYMVLCYNQSLGLEQKSQDIARRHRLLNLCSHKYVEIKNSRPIANGIDKTNFTIMELKSRTLEDGRLAFTIKGVNTKRFLCFNKKGKLISKIEWKKLDNSKRCLFTESIAPDDYYRFQLVDNSSCKLGFNRHGKALLPENCDEHPLRHQSKRKAKPPKEECYGFEKRIIEGDEPETMFPDSSDSDNLAKQVSGISQAKSPVGHQDIASADSVSQKEPHKKGKHRKQLGSRNSNRRRRSRTTRRPGFPASGLIPRPELSKVEIPHSSIAEAPLVRIRREDQGLLRTLRLLKILA